MNNSNKGQKTSGSNNIIYSIVTRNRTPKVKPGGKVEIEVFLSGYGMPKKNKLNIQYSSPYIINKEDSGNLSSVIAFYNDNNTGEAKPVSGKKYKKGHKLDHIGACVIINKGYFLKVPREPREGEVAKSEINRVMSENSWDNEPPLLLSLNISRDAPPGDYDITFILTYGDEQNLLQDYKSVPFHITSWWERNQGWIGFVGVTIALISLLISAVGRLFN